MSETFITARPGLRLVAEPKRAQHDHLGRRIGTTTGKAVEFKGETFVANETSADAGGFDSVQELLEFLHEHPKLNSPNGFYSLDSPPDAPQPLVRDQLAAITRASVTQDVQAIVAVVEVEENTHNRREVLSAAEAALEEINAILEKGTSVDESGSD